MARAMAKRRALPSWKVRGSHSASRAMDSAASRASVGLTGGVEPLQLQPGEARLVHAGSAGASMLAGRDGSGCDERLKDVQGGEGRGVALVLAHELLREATVRFERPLPDTRL